jgi:hypothetical protein
MPSVFAFSTLRSRIKPLCLSALAAGICGFLAPNPAAQTAGMGSLVYVNNSVVYVQNLATGATRSFEALESISRGGVSVSNTGIIAQIEERRGDVFWIRLTRLDGSIVREFSYQSKLSILVSGARISRDGTVVAFALNTTVPSSGFQDGRGDRVVTCTTQTDQDCVYFDNLRDPTWLPDNRLVGINYKRQFYISNGPVNFANPARSRIDPIGPNNLDQPESPETTPDGKNILFSTDEPNGHVYALDLSSQTVKQLTAGGWNQSRPMVSPDGQSLLYMQRCCQSIPGGVNTVGSASSYRIHRIPLNTRASTQTPYTQFVIRNAAGKTVPSDGRYGVTPAVLK